MLNLVICYTHWTLEVMLHLGKCGTAVTSINGGFWHSRLRSMAAYFRQNTPCLWTKCGLRIHAVTTIKIRLYPQVCGIVHEVVGWGREMEFDPVVLYVVYKHSEYLAGGKV